MGSLRILAQIGLVALAVSAAVPSLAQFYPPPPPFGGGFPPPPPPPPFYPQQQPYYQQRPQPYYQQRPQPYYQQQRPQLSSACASRRGVCYIESYAPVGSPCRCYLDGFGLKRGTIVPE